MDKEIKKEYSSNEVTVVWKPGLCIHSAMCVKGLPEVFNTKNKPWINIEGASGIEIVNQVKQCPSGALSIKGKVQKEEVLKKSEAVIADTKPFEVTLLKDKNVAWCACGHSNNQPWCDGSHKITNIKPIVFKPTEQKTAYLCMCKQSKNKPYCDGSHARLKG